MNLPLTFAAAHERGLRRLVSVEADGDLVIANWSAEPMSHEHRILHHLCGWPRRMCHRHPRSDTPSRRK